MQAEEFLSHTVMVCEICYDVAVAEHHLIEAEKKLAAALNIPVKANSSFVTNKTGAKNAITPALADSSVHMWRVMFYFDYLNRGCTFRLTIGLELGRDKYLQFKFGDHTTRYPINLQPNKHRQSLNMIRVHYFFSASKDVNAMLRGEQIALRITEGPSWDCPVFEGSSLMLAEFCPDYLAHQSIILPKISYMFAKKKEINVSLQSIVGLSYDGKIGASLLNLYKSENGVYHTDDFFYGSHPMPTAWINVLGGKKKAKEKEVEPYMPVLSNKVILPVSPRRNSPGKLFNTVRSQTTKESDRKNKAAKELVTQHSTKELNVQKPNKPIVIKKRKVKTAMHSNRQLVIAVARDLMESDSESTIENIEFSPERPEFPTRSPYEEVQVKPEKKEQKKIARKNPPKSRKDHDYTGIMFI